MAPLTPLQVLRRGFVRLQSSSSPAKSTSTTNHTISNKQSLYLTDKSSPGSIFFLPHGTRIFNKMVHFMKIQQQKYGFQEVITPLIYKNDLWKTSGHWENYKDDMYKVVGNDLTKETEEPHHHHHEYGLKPMNCPGHCIIFSKFDRSYSELPVRFSDFSSLHRNEASGALTGLTRVRRFHQDDGHIFCTLEQIDSEIHNTIKLIRDTYGVFGLNQNIEFHLSTRPENYIGEVQTWDRAEAELKKVLDEACGPGNWLVKHQDGAFYGPKIDVMITDKFEKVHQIGTIQLDFNLPERFNLSYVDMQGNRDNRPIMVHRAVFGSLERFFAILLDNYQGKWPFWLNPRQAIVIPVNSSHLEHAETIRSRLVGELLSSADDISPMTGYNFYVDIDSRSETVGNRIKEAIGKGYSYILMVGDKDIDSGTVAIRSRDSRQVQNMTVDEIYQKFIALEKKYQ